MTVKTPVGETEKFQIKLTFKDDQEVEVTFEFAKGHALAAIQAIGQIVDNSDSYTSSLAYHFRHDESVAAALKERGLGFDDDEDED